MKIQLDRPAICNQILDIIAKDDELTEQFAKACGMDLSKFDEFLNTTNISLTVNPQDE